MKLLIAIPCMDTVRYEFAESLARLCQHLSNIGVDYNLKWIATSIIYLAREELANTAINDGYEYVLWLDSDMVFTPDMFDLLRGLNKPFSTGIYRGRRGSFPYVIKGFNGEKWDKPLPAEPFKVAACGFGFVLIKTECLFQVRGKHFACFTPTIAEGEDYAFCTRWIEMGGEIYAHPDVLPDHITYVRLRGNDPTKLLEYKEQR